VPSSAVVSISRNGKLAESQRNLAKLPQCSVKRGMFVRVVGRHQEALESYRHPETGQPTNRRVFRWPVGRSLRDEYQALIQAFFGAVCAA
jgi:hypothetical protein